MSRRRGNGSGKLKDEHKAFVVQRLAVFDSPKEAADALKDEFDVEISPQGAEAYNPERRAGRRLSVRLRVLFETTRERFLDRIDEIPESHKAVRVKMLARAANYFKSRGHYLAMADMLERIAKEMGNVHTNRREFTGKDRGPIKYQDIDLMTEQQVDEELRRYGFDPDVHPASATKQ